MIIREFQLNDGSDGYNEVYLARQNFYYSYNKISPYKKIKILYFLFLTKWDKSKRQSVFVTRSKENRMLNYYKIVQRSIFEDSFRQ